MTLKSLCRSITIGVLIALLCLVGNPTSSPHNLLRVGFGAAPTHADACQDYPGRPSYFTGWTWFQPNAHNLQVTISTDPNPKICNEYNGVSYWGMVLGPKTNCQQIVEGRYQSSFVQGGWIIGNKDGQITTPMAFIEAQGINDPYCDNGPQFIQNVSGTNPYYVTINHDFFNGTNNGEVYVQGTSCPSCPGTLPIDWNNGDDSQGYSGFGVFAESHDEGTYWSGGPSVQFTSVLFSSDSLQHPQPATAPFDFSGGLDNGNNYSRYAVDIQGTNSFMVCDTRVQNTGCNRP